MSFWSFRIESRLALRNYSIVEPSPFETFATSFGLSKKIGVVAPTSCTRSGDELASRTLSTRALYFLFLLRLSSMLLGLVGVALSYALLNPSEARIPVASFMLLLRTSFWMDCSGVTPLSIFSPIYLSASSSKAADELLSPHSLLPSSKLSWCTLMPS